MAESDDYWECEQLVAGIKEPLTVLIVAGSDGPTSSQLAFYKDCIPDLGKLLEKCWPIFEPDFEAWTQKRFSGNWQDVYV